MLERKIIFSILVCIVFLIGVNFCSDNTRLFSDLSEGSANEIRNGERINKRSDGTIQSKIPYIDGQKHGDAYMYYKDGKTIQLKMIYRYGDRHGTSLKYYESGELYAETPYENDLIHGDRKTYFINGRQKAVAPYGFGLPGVGLAEFFRNGEQKVLPIIIVNRNGTNLILETSSPCKETQFYIGDLIKDSYFPKNGEGLHPVFRSDFEFKIDLNVYTPSYLAMQDIICFCKTSQGNPLVLKKRVKL